MYSGTYLVYLDILRLSFFSLTVDCWFGDLWLLWMNLLQLPAGWWVMQLCTNIIFRHSFIPGKPESSWLKIQRGDFVISFSRNPGELCKMTVKYYPDQPAHFWSSDESTMFRCFAFGFSLLRTWRNLSRPTATCLDLFFRPRTAWKVRWFILSSG